MNNNSNNNTRTSALSRRTRRNVNNLKGHQRRGKHVISKHHRGGKTRRSPRRH